MDAKSNTKAKGKTVINIEKPKNARRKMRPFFHRKPTHHA